MKAAIIFQAGDRPQYTDVPQPQATGNDQLLVTVKAAALKHLDKSRATGKHYSSEAPQGQARIIGGDGICLLTDGTRVYGMGDGMLAEHALIDKDRIVKIPDGLDDASAAALPNAVIGAAMALKFKAEIQPGDTVLVNGATGVTGRVAVQLARLYGAGYVIATGRNQQSLTELMTLGADEIIELNEVEGFESRLRLIHQTKPIDIIIDYLWGETAEAIFSVVKGKGAFGNRIRYVSIGAMAGDEIKLSASVLRSVNLQLTGSGLGAWTKQQVGQLFSEILPEAFNWAVAGKLKIETVTISLKDIAGVWDMDVPGGRRLVVEI